MLHWMLLHPLSSLPVMCTMTVEADGSIFSGGNAVEAAIALEGAGAVAVDQLFCRT